MRKGVLIGVVAISLVIIIAFISFGESCNEAVCASIVSKCLLTQSCKCDLKNNCSCCKDCSNCLNDLYTECCSCVDMCPQPNNTETELNKKSHVEELNDEFPDLFAALTQEKDELLRWVTYTFPAHQDLAIFNPKIGKEIKFATVSSDGENKEISEGQQPNCTVAYMSKCMSWNKCKASCLSMGASSYRWFHDACCECVGHACLNYGINESRCLQCPPTSTDETFEEISIAESEIAIGNDVSVDDIPKKKLIVDNVKIAAGTESEQMEAVNKAL